MASPDDKRPIRLRRSVGLLRLVLYGVGTILGAGIYVLVGEVATHAGTATPSAFAVAAILAALTGLSFAELSARFPRSAGEAVFVHQGLGWRALSTAVGLMVALIGVVSAATIAVGFAGYLDIFIELPHGLTIAVLVLSLGALALWGIEASLTVAGLMTVIEVAGLLLILAVAGDSLAELPARAGELIPTFDGGGLQGLFIGSFVAFFAFIGFEDMVNVAEEVHDVRRVLPRAILATLVITTLLYVAVAVVALLVVPPEELAGSDAPLVLVFERAGGSGAVLGAIALVALLNGALIQIVKASRVLYGLARQGSLPAALGHVHPRRRTPVRATALSTGVVLLLAASLPLATLAEFTAVVTLLTFGLANAALLAVKRRDPRPEGAIVFPAWLPAAGVAVSVALLAVELRLKLG